MSGTTAGQRRDLAAAGLGITTGVTGIMVFQDIGGDALEELHEMVSNAMLAVVLIHIAGVLVSSVMHRENLVRSMITGFKSAEPDQAISRTYRWLGAIILAVVVAFWVGYPATGLVTPGADSAHTERTMTIETGCTSSMVRGTHPA